MEVLHYRGEGREGGRKGGREGEREGGREEKGHNMCVWSKYRYAELLTHTLTLTHTHTTPPPPSHPLT